MIAYDLECRHGHSFEGWFENSDSFNEQMQRGLIACPSCGSSEISRRLSTFGIGGKAKPVEEAGPPARPPLPWEHFIRFVHDNFTDVGTEFAKEALKMHYGVAEFRNIRGVSSEQEEKTLREEGITFFKIPNLNNTNPEEE
ncbi:MAG: DUF1178 family protein [Pseudomonadota bacterium]